MLDIYIILYYNDNFRTNNNSYEDLSQTLTDNNQTKVSGCSSLELSIESTTSEPVRPVLQKIQQFINVQQPASMSPLVRRVVNETLAAAMNTGVFDEKIKTMFQTYTMPTTENQQTVQHDAPRSNPSDSLEKLENTILLSQ